MHIGDAPTDVAAALMAGAIPLGVGHFALTELLRTSHYHACPSTGDKVQQELSGPGGEPIRAEIEVRFVRSEPKTGDSEQTVTK